jgi:hypothetical protein
MTFGIVLSAPVAIALFVGAIVAGAVGIPAIINVLGPSLPTFLRAALGRLNWILAAVGNGRTVAIWLPDDSVELCHAREEVTEDGEVVVKAFYHGDWLEIDPDANWEYLGWRPFGVTFIKDEQQFGALLADPPNYAASADGGVTLLDRERQGTHFFTRWGDGAPGSWTIDVIQLCEQVRGLADNTLLKTGKDLGLQKHGGGNRALSITWWVVAIGGMAALGYALTTVQLMYL